MHTILDVGDDFLKLESNNLNLFELIKKIYVNSKHGLNTRLSKIELYSRILKPVYLVIILLFALPYVFKFSRTQNTSKKVFSGVLIGLIFNLFLKFLNVISIKVSEDPTIFFTISIVLLLLISRFSFQKKFINT